MSNPSFEPGSTFQYADLSYLSDFEDTVAHYAVDKWTPTTTQTWQARIALKECLRPAKFNGSIKDVQIEVLEDPIAELSQLHDNGFKVVDGRRVTAKEAESFDRDKSLCMALSANARSTGKGIIGAIHARLWYLPPKEIESNYITVRGDERIYTAKNFNQLGGMPLNRKIAISKIDSENLVLVDKAARLRGQSVVASRMAHPAQGGSC